MQLKLIQKNGETILPICFFGKNRNQEVLSWHQKVFNYFDIPINYIEFPFDKTGHGDAIQWIINSTLRERIPDYYWFCDMDCIPLRRDFVGIVYDKIKDKNTIFGPALATNHRNFADHIYAAAFCLFFSKKVYIDCGCPLMTDVVERSDNSQELTWECQLSGKNVCFIYPSKFHKLTREEMDSTGNPEFFKLGKYFSYGLGTTYGDMLFHSFMANVKRGNDIFIETAKQIVPQNKQDKIEAIIVSVDFADFLEITLPINKNKFDNILIVTTESDKDTQGVCLKNKVNFVTTNQFYDDGAKFNKGKVLSWALQHLKYKQWVCFLDSDCLLLDKIDLENLDIQKFYGAGRHFCWSYEDYLDFLNGRKTINDFHYIKGTGNGYMQMVNLNSSVAKSEPLSSLYPSYSENVWIDIGFLKKWCPLIENDPNLVHLSNNILHLGLHSVYKNGRNGNERFEFFKNKKFKDIKREDIQGYIKEINR